MLFHESNITDAKEVVSRAWEQLDPVLMNTASNITDNKITLEMSQHKLQRGKHSVYQVNRRGFREQFLFTWTSDQKLTLKTSFKRISHF